MIVTLQIVQMILSIALVTLVLLQGKGSGLGSAFGGDDGVYRTRRGVEKLLHQATIVLAGVFFLTAFIQIILSR